MWKKVARYDLILLALAFVEIAAMVLSTIWPGAIQHLLAGVDEPDFDVLASSMLSVACLVVGVVYLISGVHDYERELEMPLMLALMTHFTISVFGLLLLINSTC